jgi:ABC-type sugar transport system permease subunit
MIHLYETGFVNFEMGPAAAIGVILLVVIMVLTAGVLVLFKGQVEY